MVKAVCVGHVVLKRGSACVRLEASSVGSLLYVAGPRVHPQMSRSAFLRLLQRTIGSVSFSSD